MKMKDEHIKQIIEYAGRVVIAGGIAKIILSPAAVSYFAKITIGIILILWATLPMMDTKEGKKEKRKNK